VNFCAGTIPSPHASVNHKALGHVRIYNSTSYCILLPTTSACDRVKPSHNVSRAHTSHLVNAKAWHPSPLLRSEQAPASSPPSP
jgi:hypothetical protein